MEPDGLIESNWTDVVDNFDDMALKEELLRGIYAYGFERPSAIQQRAILPCIKEHDVIAQAQSGKIIATNFWCSFIFQFLHIIVLFAENWFHYLIDKNYVVLFRIRTLSLQHWHSYIIHAILLVYVLFSMIILLVSARIETWYVLELQMQCN